MTIGARLHRAPISRHGDATLKPPSLIRYPYLPRILALAAIGIVTLVAACGGNENSNAGYRPTDTPAAGPAAAGSATPGKEFQSNGNEHITPGQAHGAYFSNPPTSGWHFPELPSPGIYTTTLTPEDVPHFLEHGGIWVLYNCPEGCNDLVNQLVPVVNRATQSNKPVALAPYPLMDEKVALVAWQRLQTLDAFDEQLVQTFIDKFACRYNPEGPGLCPSAAGETAPARDAGGSGFNLSRGCTPSGNTTRTYASAPARQIVRSRMYIATITTEKGDIKVELNAKAAPITVNNFVFLACEKFFDGLTFHRVLPGFVAQGGDPKGDGSGGPGYAIPDEKSELKHEEGVIAMAKSSQPNSAGSQFYITLAPQPALDPTYTVFGKVTSGMDVVKQIALRDPSSGGNLPPGDKIVRITIEQR
jgi:cyclophilin family peptidyl-prolyl cis-trans isomerase